MLLLSIIKDAVKRIISIYELCSTWRSCFVFCGCIHLESRHLAATGQSQRPHNASRTTGCDDSGDAEIDTTHMLATINIGNRIYRVWFRHSTDKSLTVVSRQIAMNLFVYKFNFRLASRGLLWIVLCAVVYIDYNVSWKFIPYIECFSRMYIIQPINTCMQCWNMSVHKRNIYWT